MLESAGSSEPTPPLVDTTTGCTMTTSTLPLLPPDTARWRIEKLPLAEIKERLQAAGLECNGTKRTLAQRLHDYLGTQPPRADASASEDSNQQSTSEASDSETDGSPAPTSSAPVARAPAADAARLCPPEIYAR